MMRGLLLGVGFLRRQQSCCSKLCCGRFACWKVNGRQHELLGSDARVVWWKGVLEQAAAV